MSEETQADVPGVRILVEAVGDGKTIATADRLRLIVEGQPDIIEVLGWLVMNALGNQVDRAFVIDGDGTETDVTTDFQTGPYARVDILDVDGPSE